MTKSSTPAVDQVDTSFLEGLIAAGQKLMRDAEKTASDLEAHAASRLTPGETRRLIRLLKKVYL
jgi:hypothetical protein